MQSCGLDMQLAQQVGKVQFSRQWPCEFFAGCFAQAVQYHNSSFACCSLREHTYWIASPPMRLGAVRCCRGSTSLRVQSDSSSTSRAFVPVALSCFAVAHRLFRVHELYSEKASIGLASGTCCQQSWDGEFKQSSQSWDGEFKQSSSYTPEVQTAAFVFDLRAQLPH